MLSQFEKVIIVTGHYGSGKTNLSLNLAVDLQKSGQSVVLADLDVTNPYFRTSDYKQYAQQNGVEVALSDYANTTLEIPALTGKLEALIGGEKTLIIDVGGDDAGAVALGRYYDRINEKPYTMLYVINSFRYLMQQEADSLNMLLQIQAVSRLKATHVVNNSNLARETTSADVIGSVGYAKKMAELARLPLAFTSVCHKIAKECGEIENIYPVEVIVTTPWS